MKKDTGEYPPYYRNKPRLRKDCVKYYDAYQLLSRSRIWSQVGPEPIQISECLALVKDGLGIRESYTRMKYLRLFKRMDEVHLEHLKSKMAKA